MPKDTKSLGNNKAPACESRGFVHKKRRRAFWHTFILPQDMYYSPCCEDDFEEVHCDENGIVEEVEIEEEVEDYLEYVTYTRDWYYENCDNKCDVCKFYDNNNKVCKWEA